VIDTKVAHKMLEKLTGFLSEQNAFFLPTLTLPSQPSLNKTSSQIGLKEKSSRSNFHLFAHPSIFSGLKK